MATLAKLEISDGTTTVNLLTGSGQTGFSLRNWDPAVIQPKGGGVFQDSPLAAGRRLVYAVDATAVEDLTVDINDYDQDGLIAQAQDLMRLLLKARAYQSTEFQDEPVWIRARSNCETNDRYALIINWAIPQLSNPYAQPFVSASEISTMDEISLQLERGHWRANEPGVGECVETSNSQTWDYGFTIDAVAAGISTMPVSEITRHAGSGNLYAASGARDIDRSTDDGASWGVNFTAGIGSIRYSIYALANNNLLCGGSNPGMYRSTNDGGAWSDVSAATMASVYGIIQRSSTGTVIAVGQNTSNIGAIWRSTDNGASWTQIFFTSSPDNFYSVTVDSSGNFIAIGSNGILYRSTDDGATWSYFSVLASYSTKPNKIFTATDGTLYAVSNGLSTSGVLWTSSDGGVTWTVVYSNINYYLWNVIQSSTSTVFFAVVSSRLVPRKVELWVSNDSGVNWASRSVLISSVTGTMALRNGLYQTPDDRLHIGSGSPAGGTSGSIFRTGVSASHTVGRTATCENEVFAANKGILANLTHIFVDDGGVFGANQVTSTAFTMFPAVPAANDALYFGIQSSIADVGHFTGLFFDIGTVMFGNYTLIIEYSIAGPGWSTLTTQDSTLSFSVSGVNAITWTPPSNWVPVAVNGVTAYWVRVRVSALSGAVTPPTQQNRTIYAPVLGYVDIDQAQIVGDIPAIIQLKAFNRSDKDGPGGSAPNLYANRIIAGLRSVERGSDFRAYLNLSDRQLGYGFTTYAGDGVTANGTTFDDDIAAPTGRRMTYNPGGVEAMSTRAVISISSTVIRDFYGIFHAFLRARRTAGNAADISVRLQVVTGSGGIIFTTSNRQLQTTTAFEVLDFGEIALPVSGSFKSSDLADVTEIRIQASAASGTPDLYLYDLILIPVDEWAIDAVDTVNSSISDAGRSNGIAKLLDIDSLTDPRTDIRTLVRLTSGDFVSAEYNPITNGPAILQTNKDQRLWFLAMMTSATGASYSWLAPPEIVHSVQLFKNEGYLGQRGAR